jgi:hypothetical protein
MERGGRGEFVANLKKTSQQSVRQWIDSIYCARRRHPVSRFSGSDEVRSEVAVDSLAMPACGFPKLWFVKVPHPIWPMMS